MSVSERRHNFRDDRVLLETTRILTPQFDDAVVYLTGAQVEMLRNMTQYLRRRTSYVTTYGEGYYLTPTVADYDDILAVVADLEDTLMGNPNTIWGYKDTFARYLLKTVTVPGTNYIYMGAVPAGEVWVVNAAAMMNVDSVCSSMVLNVVLDSQTHFEFETASPPANERQYWHGEIILKEGDYISAAFHDCVIDDHLQAHARGYQMDVPA